jgi:sugar-specific transcriptional regulator TrmB
MTARELFRRKRLLGWSDAEAGVLLELAAERAASLTDIVEATRIPVTSAHSALDTLASRGYVMLTMTIPPSKYYSLTIDGREAVRALLTP